MGFFDFIKK